MKNKDFKGEIILTGNQKQDYEKILINIRDWKKREKIKLIEYILKFGQIDLKKINQIKIIEKRVK